MRRRALPVHGQRFSRRTFCTAWSRLSLPENRHRVLNRFCKTVYQRGEAQLNRTTRRAAQPYRNFAATSVRPRLDGAAHLQPHWQLPQCGQFPLATEGDSDGESGGKLA